MNKQPYKAIASAILTLAFADLDSSNNTDRNSAIDFFESGRYTLQADILGYDYEPIIAEYKERVK